MEDLKKQHAALHKQLYGEKKDGKPVQGKEGVLETSTAREVDLNKQYKKAYFEFQSNMEDYDSKLKQYTIDNQKTQGEYDDTYSDLLELKEEYKLRLQEKKKRDEIAAIMQKKTDEMNAKKEKLVKASEFI